MLEWSWLTNNGKLSSYIMPYFRERTFPGSNGRLRTPLVVDTDHAQYESGSEEYHPDFALRYHHLFGNLEVALSGFHGTDRNPDLILAATRDSLIPYYRQTTRLGIDGLYILDDWIFKWEYLSQKRAGHWEEAATGGFEKTLVGIHNSSHDLGLLLEGAWHSAGDTATPFSSEIMGGLRWVWNDEAGTELLTGAIVDTKLASTILSIEASRRLNDQIKINLEARLFSNIDASDPLYSLRDDDYVKLETHYFF